MAGLPRSQPAEVGQASPSSSWAIGYLHALTVAPITSTIRDIPPKVYLSPEDGLMAECAANPYNIQTAHKAALGPPIAYLPQERWEEVDRAVAFALGLDLTVAW